MSWVKVDLKKKLNKTKYAPFLVVFFFATICADCPANKVIGLFGFKR